MTRQELIDKLIEWRAEEIVSRYLNSYTNITPEGSKKTRHQIMLANSLKTYNNLTNERLHEMFIKELIRRANG